MAVTPEIKTRFTFDGLKTASTGLRAVGRNVLEVFSGIRKTGGTALKPFDTGLRGIEKQTANVSKEILRMGSATTWRGVKVGAVGAGAAFVGLRAKVTAVSGAAIKAAKDTAASLNSISIDAQRIGGNASDVAVLGYAAEATGTDRDELITQISTLSNEFLTLRENIFKAQDTYQEFLGNTSKEAAIAARLRNQDGLNGVLTGFSAADLEARKASITDIEARIDQIDAATNKLYVRGDRRGGVYGDAARLTLQKERQQLVAAAEQFRNSQSTQGQGLFELLDYGLDFDQATMGGVEGLVAISEAFQRVENPSQKARIAMRLFGEDAGVKLVPLLNGGRKAIEDYRKEMERLGGIATPEDIANAEKYTTATQNLKTAAAGVKMAIGRSLLPDLTQSSVELTEWLVKSRAEIAKYATEAFKDTRTLAEDAISLFGGNTDDVKTPWLDTVVQKTIGLSALWADVRKQISLLWEGKDSDYAWVNSIRDGFISIKKFAMDAWAVVSGGNAVDFKWLNTARDYVVAFATRFQEAFSMLKDLVASLADFFKPVLDYLGKDIMTIGLFLGLTRMVGLFGILTTGAGLLFKALGAVFGLAGAAAGAVGAIGGAAGGAAGAAGTAAATAGGLRVALAGVGAAIGGLTSGAVLLGTTLVGAFALGQMAAKKMTEGTQAAYEEVWKQQAALIRAQSQGRINELLKSRDPASDDFRKRYWADKNVNIVTAADRAALGVKKMDDFIGWTRADGIESTRSASDNRRAAQPPAAVFRYDINVNGRQAQGTGDMNLKRALDELNNGFS